MKLYKVKEVCEASGLTRKQLFDYQKLVQPTSFDKSGYKLYNEGALRKLITIAELRKIDVSLADISKFLDDEVQLEAVLQNQIKCLTERKDNIEAMIIKAREMLENS